MLELLAVIQEGSLALQDLRVALCQVEEACDSGWGFMCGICIREAGGLQPVGNVCQYQMAGLGRLLNLCLGFLPLTENRADCNPSCRCCHPPNLLDLPSVICVGMFGGADHREAQRWDVDLWFIPPWSTIPIECCFCAQCCNS